jgi:hypothetical protein
MPICIDCKKKVGKTPMIKGRVHNKYRLNKIVIQEYLCEMHWCERGQPEIESIAGLTKK